MSRRFILALIIIVPIVSAIGAVGVQAQLINPFGRGCCDFSKADLTALRAKLWPLLDRGSKGAVDTWRNDLSGNFGTMKIERKYKREGLSCRTVTHLVRLKSDKTARRFVVSYCKVADNTWKTAP